MNIGELTRNENGTISGYIAEADFDYGNIFLEKVASDNPRAPLFNLMTRSPRGRAVRLGSIWERASQETGELYFAGYIDTARSGYVPLRIFRSNQDPKIWNLVRATARRRQTPSDMIVLPDPETGDRDAVQDGAARPRRQRTARTAPAEDQSMAA